MYADTKKEFEDALTKITLMGYGILIIAHSQKKTVDMGEFTIEKVSPNIPTRAAEIVNRLVDIIAYAHEEFDENGNSTRWLITRSTPTIAAGSRIKYLDPKIPFTYDDLVDAIGRAIEKEQELDDIEVVETSQRAELIVLDYKEIRKEAEQLWGKLLEINPENAKIVLKKVEIIFGRPIKLSEITEDQVDLYNLILIEMRDLYEECTKPLV